MLESLKKVQAVTDKLITFVIICLFLLMFGITNANVITRYFFNSPIVIAVETGRYCFVAIIFIGAIFTTRRDMHISLDFVVAHFPERVAFYISQAGRLLTAGFFLLFTFYAIRMVNMNWKVESSATHIPMAIPYIPLVLGGIGIAIEQTISIIRYQMGIGVKDLEKQKAQVAAAEEGK